MYTWRVVGRDPSADALCAGIGDELAPVMRLIEGYLARAAGFIGCIAEVEPRLSIYGLEPVHVHTGRRWIALRDRHGGCHWTAQETGAGTPDAWSFHGGAGDHDHVPPRQR
jgi:hypothetical protein